MVKKIAILGGQEGLNQLLGDLFKRNHLPLFDGEFANDCSVERIDAGTDDRMILFDGAERGKVLL